MNDKKTMSYMHYRIDMYRQTNMKDQIIDKIFRAVESEYAIKREKFLVRSRLMQLVQPRQLTMWLLRKYNPLMTLSEIGIVTKPSDGAEWDHSTVLYAVKSFQVLYTYDKRYRDIMDRCIKHIENSNAIIDC